MQIGLETRTNFIRDLSDSFRSNGLKRERPFRCVEFYAIPPVKNGLRTRKRETEKERQAERESWRYRERSSSH